MKKFKEKIQENYERILGTTPKPEETIEVKQEEKVDLPCELIGMIQTPGTKGHKYSWVKVKLNPETLQAVVETVIPCLDKTTGYAMILDNENRGYLFHKANRGEKV